MSLLFFRSTGQHGFSLASIRFSPFSHRQESAATSCYTLLFVLQTTLPVRHVYWIYCQHSLSCVVTHLCYLFKALKWTKQLKCTSWRTHSSFPSATSHLLWGHLYTSPQRWARYSVKLTFIFLFFFFNHCLHAAITCSANNPQLRISRYDRKPLGSEDLLYSAVIEVTQRTSSGSDEATTLTLPVPEDGNVRLEFRVQEEAVMLLIRVGI